MGNKLPISKEHHAYFFSGEKEKLEKLIFAHFKDEEKINLSGNPDFLLLRQEVFGIGDARYLKEWQEKNPLGEEGKIALLIFSFITTESQNALLKMFEEPLGKSRFFIIAPTSAILLRTLRSRLILFSEESSTKNLLEAENFLKANVDERMLFVEKYKDAENENKKSELLALCGDIETILYKKIKEGVTNKDFVKSLSDSMFLKKYLFTRSPSVKMIAEYLAISLPNINIAK